MASHQLIESTVQLQSIAPRQAQPPPRSHAPMTMETTKTIALFRGDYSDKKEPVDLFMLFQLTLPESWMDDQMVRRFGYDSWDSYLEAVRGIRKEMLDVEQQKLEENKARDNVVVNLQQQMIQMSLRMQPQPWIPNPTHMPAANIGTPMPPFGMPMGFSRPPNATANMGRGTPLSYIPLSRSQILEKQMPSPSNPAQR
ncbi:hypothetical protein PAXRUDRAFT_27397 [Paxillus rubicundulus Ve08.2h10]|uniref:Uncharacterized protein n=1 Tax=Paxillus rubicundulus Ve08.2h10 TaxID=930991 RepID=A0A0D0E0G3_9AGAM|nr:hypothetical protein PAXRUDRAFT_27397 [Paxillus rubicundulus Ve08.2h10]